MKKMKLTLIWMIVVLLSIGAFGCTSQQIAETIGLAVSAGAAYGISKAVKK